MSRDGKRWVWLACARCALWLSLVAALRPNPVDAAPNAQAAPFPIGHHAWRATEQRAIRGITIGPIENQLHPDRGYGSEACARTMLEVRALGGNWVSLTPFGRVWDGKSTGISRRFELPYATNKKLVKAAVAQAHARRLRVLLVPHLWVESGEWRALIDPGNDQGWATWQKSYASFVLGWAELAAQAKVDMFAVGVEMRRWLTTPKVRSFFPIIEQIREVYPGPLTYAANWDDADDTLIWQKLDLIGINAFYPLAQHPNAELPELVAGAARVTERARQLAERYDKPVVFTEFGYTTRDDPALRPWEWPEQLGRVAINERAQALAYRAFLSQVMPEPWVAGVFVWRLYADPDDISQEPEWGFSPRGKLAELELRDAFFGRFGADPFRPVASPFTRGAAQVPGLF